MEFHRTYSITWINNLLRIPALVSTAQALKNFYIPGRGLGKSFPLYLSSCFVKVALYGTILYTDIRHAYTSLNTAKLNFPLKTGITSCWYSHPQLSPLGTVQAYQWGRLSSRPLLTVAMTEERCRQVAAQNNPAPTRCHHLSISSFLRSHFTLNFIKDLLRIASY
jgi:hypothetical protein